MDIKKILLVALIAVALVASVSAVSAGLFDGLMGGEQQQDNVVELDEMSFNTTNATDFQEFDKPSEDENVKITCYISDNGNGDHILVVMDYSKLYEIDPTADEQMEDMILEGMKDDPHEIVNGIVIYPSAPVYHEEVDVKQMYSACVQNEKSHKLIMLSSPDANETAKMASTLKFK